MFIKSALLCSLLGSLFLAINARLHDRRGLSNYDYDAGCNLKKKVCGADRFTCANECIAYCQVRSIAQHTSSQGVLI
jgi:hypothetical protein